MTITVGANPPLTITFGTGGGQVSTMAELQTALGTLTGGTASVNTANGNIKVTASSLGRHDPGRRHRDARRISASTRRPALPSNQQVLGLDTTDVHQPVDRRRRDHQLRPVRARR